MEYRLVLLHLLPSPLGLLLHRLGLHHLTRRLLLHLLPSPLGLLHLLPPA